LQPWSNHNLLYLVASSKYLYFQIKNCCKEKNANHESFDACRKHTAETLLSATADLLALIPHVVKIVGICSFHNYTPYTSDSPGPTGG
jgi:hypothetical protein